MNSVNSKVKVLIAEDMEIYITIYKNHLEDTYDLIFAKDGAEAVEKFQKESPDIVLMDILMPVENGIESLKKMKEINKRTPVIAVTVLSENSEKKEILGYGFSDYIAKPVKKESLMDIISTYV